MIKKTLIFLIIIASFSYSCDRYKKILKGNDKDLKYETAVKLYKQQNYSSALQFFEELVTLFRGTDKAEMVYYYYAYSYYGTGDYMMASFHFKNFSKLFPGSKYSEECAYMAAYCNIMMRRAIRSIRVLRLMQLMNFSFLLIFILKR